MRAWLPGDVLAEAQALAASGVREINLIAQDLTAYGRDLRPTSSLAELLRGLNEIESLHWFSLLYCYPNFVTAELLDAIAELPKVVKILIYRFSMPTMTPSGRCQT